MSPNFPKTGLNLKEMNWLRRRSEAAKLKFENLGISIIPLDYELHKKLNLKINEIYQGGISSELFYGDEWNAARDYLGKFHKNASVFALDYDRWESPSFKLNSEEMEHICNQLPHKFFNDGFYLLNDELNSFIRVDYHFELSDYHNFPIEVEIEVRLFTLTP